MDEYTIDPVLYLVVLNNTIYIFWLCVDNAARLGAVAMGNLLGLGLGLKVATDETNVDLKFAFSWIVGISEVMEFSPGMLKFPSVVLESFARVLDLFFPALGLHLEHSIFEELPVSPLTTGVV